jgi:GTP-binding protein Era
LLNKIDTTEQAELEAQVAHWQQLLPAAEIFPISALQGFGVKEVFERILELLPEAPAYFPKDQLTDRPERFFVGEIIREKILKHYKKEIPYSVEIETESFEETEELIRIGAVIMVERKSQKGILIGHKGSALKRVGTEARKDMEQFFAKKVFLEIFVKVNKNWRSDPRQLRRFGYSGK